MIRRLKSDPALSHVDVVGGNVATRAGAQALVDAGAGPAGATAAVGRSAMSRSTVCAPRASRVPIATSTTTGSGRPFTVMLSRTNVAVSKRFWYSKRRRSVGS